MLLKAFTALLSLAIHFGISAKIVEPTHTLFLVGGGLKTCSSQSSSNCISRKFDQKSHKISAQYQITERNLERFFVAWPADHLPKQRQKMQRLLSRMGRVEAILDRQELRNLWQKYDTAFVINQLADREFYLMLDSLEIEQKDANGRRKKEKVALIDTENKYSVEIFNRFVKLASSNMATKSLSESTKPKVLVITASARDSFEAVDFYLQAFQQAGADTAWLPIDAAVNAAWQSELSLQESCTALAAFRQKEMGAYYKHEVYPDLAKQQKKACLEKSKTINTVTTADAIFINGGDQSLTLKAFVNKDKSDSELLTVIKTQLNNKQLLLGGTSAGTAVMSGGGASPVMITNGRSEVAIIRGAKADQLPSEGCFKNNTCKEGLLVNDLTYNSNGGLGLFPYGVLDTHFSERGRQGRLAILLKDTSSKFGFGVDETTALIVSEGSQGSSFSVIGQGGVFIIEYNLKQQIGNSEFMTHYLTREDTAALLNDEIQVDFAEWKKESAVENQVELISENIFDGSNYRTLATLLCMTNAQIVKGLSVWQTNKKVVDLRKTENSVSVFGVIKTNKEMTQLCSYSNYALSIRNP
jgi:cyanophycinase